MNECIYKWMYECLSYAFSGSSSPFLLFIGDHRRREKILPLLITQFVQGGSYTTEWNHSVTSKPGSRIYFYFWKIIVLVSFPQIAPQITKTVLEDLMKQPC